MANGIVDVAPSNIYLSELIVGIGVVGTASIASLRSRQPRRSGYWLEHCKSEMIFDSESDGRAGVPGETLSPPHPNDSSDERLAGIVVDLLHLRVKNATAANSLRPERNRRAEQPYA
jgi:hypothetical protein